MATLPTAAAAAGPAAWLTILPSAWTMGLIGATVTHQHAKFTFERRRQALIGLIGSFTLRRASIGLDDKEKALARAMAALFARGQIAGADWDRFAAQLTWGDGQAILEPTASLARHQHLPEARQVLADLLKANIEPHRAFLAAAAAMVARQHAGLPAVLRQLLNPGARWLTADDLSAQGLLSLTRTPASLIIGHDPATGRPLYYARNESLFSIGGPGTGKTECQVLPNLLSYPGSAFVLDVKGELWEKTAGYRKKHFGPVYRFAPTDPAGYSHRYNPFDFIARDPEQAATDCEVFSAQVIVPTANHHRSLLGKPGPGFPVGHGHDRGAALQGAIARHGDPDASSVGAVGRQIQRQGLSGVRYRETGERPASAGGFDEGARAGRACQCHQGRPGQPAFGKRRRQCPAVSEHLLALGVACAPP